MRTFTTQFKVISVSENTNAFGLYGVILCDRGGLAFEVGVSGLNCPKKGNYITGQVTEDESLYMLPFSYEIPRKLERPDAATLREMFPDIPKKQKNVAKGKKVTNTLDFAKVYNKLDVNKKIGVIKNIQKTLETGITPRGTRLGDGERKATEQLLRWCNINLLVGDDLCPPENVNLM